MGKENSDKRIIYLTGATGRLGKEVLRRIPDATPLVRKDSGLSGQIVTDFSERELKGILNDADVIVHIAGSIDTLDKKKLQEANVELTRKIVASAPKKSRIIFAGSVSVYGKKLAQVPADERTPINPDSDYAGSKYDAEKLISAHPDHVILRIGTIYGPGFGDYYKVLSYIERGKMKIIGDGSNRVPFVHVEDVADAIASAVSKGKGVYVIAGDPLTQKEIYSVAARALDVKEPGSTVSKSAAGLLASFQEFTYHLGGKKPLLTKEHISVLANDRVFDCSKAKKDLGFSPRPLDHGIREMVLSYKKRPSA
jgi:nucleoside-diphosphate-sugar epimerase